MWCVALIRLPVNDQTAKTHKYDVVGWLTCTLVLDSGLDPDHEDLYVHRIVCINVVESNTLIFRSQKTQADKQYVAGSLTDNVTTNQKSFAVGMKPTIVSRARRKSPSAHSSCRTRATCRARNRRSSIRRSSTSCRCGIAA